MHGAAISSQGEPPAAVNARGTLLAICLALFVLAVSTTSINTLLPVIADSLHASVASLGWVIKSYMLVTAALVVAGGQLGDLFGRRRMLLLGLVLFAVASAVIALAQNMPVLILGRAGQGLAAAFVAPATLSIADVAFPPEERATAIGIWGAGGGLGLALGPLIGGAFN